jgi:hypothetical protein
METKNKLRKLVKKKDKEKENSAFEESSPKKRTGRESIPGVEGPIGSSRRSIRIPGLRTFKRLVTSALLVLSGCLTIGLMSSFYPSTMNLALLWFFLLSMWIFLDYLWKTRHHEDKEAFGRDAD